MSDLPIQHSAAFRARRALNWFPLGLAYAFLYMGRYNLTVAKNALGDLMTKEDFGFIFLVGTWVYGTAFLLNGPLTDKIGGRRSMLVSLFGSAAANAAMGFFLHAMLTGCDPGSVDIRFWMSALYGVNMYFQSFGAVAIVKVNASWFHVRERGGFSGIFGTMISSGIFMAFTVNGWILQLLKPADGGLLPSWHVFFVPAALLGSIFVVESFLLRDRPSQAGHADFDTGDADSGADAGAPVSVGSIMRRIFTNPIILTIAAIEFCTGLVRQGVMQWFPIYLKEVWVLPSKHPLVNGDVTGRLPLFVTVFVVAVALFLWARRLKGSQRRLAIVAGALVALAPFSVWGWGGLLFVAGVIGGNVAGYVSDLFFQSRRAPAAGGLDLLLTICAVVMVFSLGGTTSEVGWAVPAKGKEGQPPPPALQVGDRIVEVAGRNGFSNWKEISETVRCLPAACGRPKCQTEIAHWDPDACTCSTKASPDPSIAPSDGTIAMTVVRGGEEMELTIRDPKATMMAGDSRALAAGPRLTLSPWVLGVLGFLMSLCVIGTHGLLSGTATMDFGGRRGAATAVGVIDGFVYLGSGVQALALGSLTTKDWSYWPIFLVPFSLAGFLLCLPIWNSKPRKGGGH